MIQHETIVLVADNSGAKEALVFGIIKGSSKIATVGDVVNVAIKKVLPNGSLKKWETSRAVVVRTVKEIRRKDGTYIRFWDNAVALITKEGKPLGKRIFWPVARELREKWFKDIAWLAEEVI